VPNTGKMLGVSDPGATVWLSKARPGRKLGWSLHLVEADGGFVGVDVFFVISGYLIASIIVEEMRGGRFSFGQFFERRARRIIPALYAVIIVTIPLGWLFMLPDNFENFGQSIVATVGVSNNILLFKTSGYWDLANEFKPLLHTWSLGVEEQFYLVFPLLLLALVPRGKRATAWVLAVVAVLSLVSAQWFVATKPLAAFHLLPMRLRHRLQRNDRPPSLLQRPRGRLLPLACSCELLEQTF
jgi:peptidoglycan/LPS O-acetylase OafA/YrhL